MIDLLAQTFPTTQPDMTTWTPAATVAVITAVVTGLITIIGAAAALVVAWRSNTKATEAKAEAAATKERQDRQSERMGAVENRNFQTALAATPPKPLKD